MIFAWQARLVQWFGRALSGLPEQVFLGEGRDLWGGEF